MPPINWPIESHTSLVVDGKAIVEGLADYGLRFVENPPLPVLYYKGRRVTDPWSVVLLHESPRDSNGSSG